MATKEEREARREHRRQVVLHAPAMPETMPAAQRGPVSLTVAAFPHVTALMDEPDFRRVTGSLSAEDSPNGRCAIDDVIAAQMVKARAKKNGRDQIIETATLAKLITAVKRCLHACGISRTQRLKAGEQALLTAGSAQPAE